MQHDLALAAGHGKIDNMRDIAFTVNYSIRQLGADLLLEVVGQLLHMGVILVEMRHANLARLGKRGNIRHGFGARTHAALLTAAEGQRRQTQTLLDIQCTDALGCADFVAGNAHQVAVPFFRRQAYTAKTLYGINMEQRLGCLGLEQLSELFDRLYRADLVVDQLAGEKNGVLGQCFAQHLGRDVTGCVRCKENYVEAVRSKLLCGVDGCRVLDLGRDDAALFMSVEVSGTAQADVGALRAAGGEIYFLGQTAERRRDRPAAVLKQMRGLQTHAVQAGRVAELLAHRVNGRFGCFGQHAGRRRVIKIMHRKTNSFIGADRRAAILPAIIKYFTTAGRLLQDKNVQNGIEK